MPASQVQPVDVTDARETNDTAQLPGPRPRAMSRGTQHCGHDQQRYDGCGQSGLDRGGDEVAVSVMLEALRARRHRFGASQRGAM